MTQSIHQLLTALERAQYLDTRSADDLPWVTVTLNAGLRFSGNVLSCTAQILQLRGEAGAQHYLAMREIAGVTLSKAEELADVLSGGQVERPLEDVPTGLALRRHANDIAERLGVAVTLPAGDLRDAAAQSALVRQLDALESAVTQVLEEFGDEARSAFQSLELQVSEQPGVALTDGALIASFDPASGPNGRLTGDQLVRAIQRAC